MDYNLEEDPFAPDEPTAQEEKTTPNGIKIPAGGPIYGGKRSEIPNPQPLPDWEGTDIQDWQDGADGSVDYSDLAALNRDLQRLRIRMAKIRREMRRAAREATEAKLKYQRSLRRALVQQSGGSAESRKASAELLCEDLEADMVMKAQVADEYNTLFRSVRDDVENAKVVAYNLRALMTI
jgi:hypothetical protein